MSEIGEDGTLARAVFAGLTPSLRVDRERPARQDAGRLPRGVLTTGTIVLAGAMTVSMNLTGPLDAQAAVGKRAKPPQAESAGAAGGAIAAAVAPQSAPATYTVKAGDTVSAIAARYGLSTASVLTLNGLSWKSLIFPGQVLKLAKPSASPRPQAPAPQQPVASPSAVTSYIVKAGDTVSAIAARFRLTTQRVLDANGLKWSSIIYPGQKIKIPGASAPDAPSIEVEEIASSTPAAPYRHIVKSGDTISAIAAKYGVSMQKVLDANGLKISSLIYPGQKILIPGTSAETGSVTQLSDEQAGNARIIIEIGRSLGVPDRGIVIALATAMQESSLRNIPYGDRDSVGLFQQRPSAGWGTVAQIMDPEHAARLFYGGPKNPNRGNTAGLLDIKGWQSMTLTQAAQAVQVSAFPNAYAKWETSAWAWFSQLG